MDSEHVTQIIRTIEHHVSAARKAVRDNDAAALDAAGNEISGLGDMLRDAS